MAMHSRDRRALRGHHDAPPSEHDAPGAPVRELEPGIPALRVDRDAPLVLIAEPHRVTVWDGGEAIARWPGQWTDAAIG
jgi:hypothetical protein